MAIAAGRSLMSAATGAPTDIFLSYARENRAVAKRLRRIVDPFNYRTSLTQPKLIVLAANDQNTPLEALDLYWDQLQGEKYILYLPNNIHNVSDLMRISGSVAEARHLIADSLPDLILLDWMLPDVSGIEFAHTLKRDEQTKHIPIIMLTARGDEGDKVRGLEVGADDYVTKPFSVNVLMQRIKTLLRRQESQTDDRSVVVTQGISIDCKRWIAGYKLICMRVHDSRPCIIRDAQFSDLVCVKRTCIDLSKS